MILHTNDLHSHLENWPKVRRFLLTKKADALAAGKKVLLFDLGDFVDRWHPLTEATNGQANIHLMNTIHYDAVTIGNNEGIGNSKEELNHLYDEANVDVILGNLYDAQTGQLPKWAKRYKLIKISSETTIGVIGLTAAFPLTYRPNGWDIRNPISELAEIIKEIRSKCTCLILLSHLGIDKDVKIAHQFPEIDVLLGSHTHHVFRHGEIVEQTQLSAAGKFGQFVGEVHVMIDEGKILESYAQALPTSEFPSERTDELEVENYLWEGHQRLKRQQIAFSDQALTVDRNGEASLMQLTINALKERGQTEVAILNKGLFLADIPAGIINADQLHKTLPHPMHLIRVTLTGKELIRLIREMEKNRGFLRKFPMTGMGFRGKVFGELYYDGLTVDRKSKEIFWQGKSIEPSAEYALTTVDHLMFIPFFPTIELAGTVEFLFPEFLRTVLGNYLHEYYPIK